jgi:peptide/nickel transport system substrate-binding protein
MDSPTDDSVALATPRLTRRQALKSGGLTGLGIALLGACAPSTTRPPEASSAAPQPAPSGVRTGGTINFYLMTENPPTLDPYLNVSFRSQYFAAFFYSRLLMSKKGPDVAPNAYVMEGDLAESWQVSEDGKTYTFNLRPDARWHDLPPLNGRPVTGQDVAWSFERFMRLSPQKNAFDQVAEVSAPTERSVQFRLKDVYAPFETSIGAPIFWILPREVVEQDGDAAKRIVGSGPFLFDKFESGVGFSGRKNPTYYRPGEPRVAEFAASIIPDVATRMAGLRGRELDAAEVEQQDLDSLKKSNPNLQVVESPWLYIPFVYWKLDRPPFNDLRVRQAVSMGINREQRLKVIYEGRGGWNNFIPWGLSDWWLDPQGPDMGPNARYFKYDPAEARRLLAAAGYPNGLQVDLISTPGYGQIWVQGVELMQQDLKAIGIDATIKMQEYASYIATTYAGQFEGGLVYGLLTPFTEPHDYLFNQYHPKGTRNNAGVNDPRLTEMIERQMRTLDRAERKQQVFEIQRYLAEQMYYPPNAVGYRSFGLQPYVRDFYYPSDYGIGAEVIPKLWLDK